MSETKKKSKKQKQKQGENSNGNGALKQPKHKDEEVLEPAAKRNRFENPTVEEHTDLNAHEDKKKRQKQVDLPELRLTAAGCQAALSLPAEARAPITLMDVQQLLLCTLMGKNSPCQPQRWCTLEHADKLANSVVVVLEGLPLDTYAAHATIFKQANEIFDSQLELSTPVLTAGASQLTGCVPIIGELLQAPLAISKLSQLHDAHQSLGAALKQRKADQQQLAEYERGPLHPDDRFPRTKLLLSAVQMIEEGYPMPLVDDTIDRFKSYVYTKDTYAPVTNSSPLYGVDCEMCRTATGANELTRISIVNERYELVYETLVRPLNKIVNYLTEYSGITPELLRGVTKRLKQVQREVSALLPPDAILVGQSLNSDLNAMQMIHPYVIDSSVCFNISGNRRQKSRLKHLAEVYLREQIQNDAAGHDSIQDAASALKLVKLKLSQQLHFGDALLSEQQQLVDYLNATAPLPALNMPRTTVMQIGAARRFLGPYVQKVTADVALNLLQTHNVDTVNIAVKDVRRIVPENALTFVDLLVMPNDITPELVVESLSSIDRMIGELWQSVNTQGLFMVLMSGTEQCPKGVLQIAIKN